LQALASFTFTSKYLKKQRVYSASCLQVADRALEDRVKDSGKAGQK